MQFGKSLLGGIIGAAVGIGLLLVVYRVFNIDGFWLAIPLAIVTGLGVRMAVRTTGHASYLRGAITAILALAGFMGWFLLAAGMTKASANARGPRPDVAEQESADPAASDAKEEAAPAETPPGPVGPVRDLSGTRRPMAPKGTMSTWDMICLGIAALVAYEMGRGSGAMPVAVENTVGTEPADANPPA